MKCPNCGRQPITFKQWLKISSWLFWTCNHCKVRLRANWKTFSFLGLLIPISFGIMVTVKYLQWKRILGPGVDASLSFTVSSAGVIAIPFLCFGYLLGGYAKRE